MSKSAHSAFEETSGTLDERLMAALSKIALAARHALRQRAARHRLSALQAQALSLLAREDSIEMGQLASRLALTPATVSDSVAALERHRLAHRRPVAEDHRRIRVTATAKGRRLGRSLALWTELFYRGIALLSSEEKQVVFRVLIRMILSLLENGVIQEARMCVTCAYFRPGVHEDPARPHHCALANVPLGPSTLRIDCFDHKRGIAPETAMDQVALWLGSTP